MNNTNQPRHCRLTIALGTALLMSGAPAAFAEGTQPPAADAESPSLDPIVVIGSLIPQTQVQTFTPVTVISAEDIQARGFTSVADALQQSSFATGSVAGSQSSGAFSQGARTASLFGLSVSYAKYLINGRPMADYPALYNGSDAFNNISGIPIDLVERIEILPGGQSSLYGSDAIGGVVNIILRKRIEGTVLSARAGAYTGGGGDNWRVSGATGFTAHDGRLNVLAGAQYEEHDPIWGHQREITERSFDEGSSPAIASYDYLVYGYTDLASQGFSNFGFVSPDAGQCANVSGQFGGTTGVQSAPGVAGEYCGSFHTAGYRTLLNGHKSGQVYTHATYDFNPDHQLYGDLLFSDEEQEYHTGPHLNWWGSGVNWGYFYDPSLDGLVKIQRHFSPEDMGGYDNTMIRDESQSYSAAFGALGRLGAWDYDVSATRTGYELEENRFSRFAGPIDSYFQEQVLGPQLGVDPYFGVYPVFTPDYAAFYSPMSREDFDSFTGYTVSRSKTSDTTLRAQVMNTRLFQLPGGHAGLAAAVEGGRQTWDNTPDPRLLNGDVWDMTAVAGSGKRNRQAIVSELQMPLLDPLTVIASGRYDNYDPDGAESVGKGTYSLGLEWRPAESLLLRGKLGTAFKAPTLPDQFQAESGYYGFVTDYYACQLEGYGPDDIGNCPFQFASRQYFGTTSGSIDLEPLTADVWSAGVVWAPVANFSISADYHHWDIRNKVGLQNADGLALREMNCRTGQDGYDIDSALCQDALAKIERDFGGQIVGIHTPKVNEARETLEAVSAAINYDVDIGTAGQLYFSGSYTASLEHESIAFAGDEAVDLLRRPGWNAAPRSKANASVTWERGDWSSTFYVNRIGHTPNYRARVVDSYDDPAARKLEPQMIYNMSVSYRATDALDVSLMINNLFDDMPPKDRTYPGDSGAPYNEEQYNPYGTAVYLEARYRFGQ